MTSERIMTMGEIVEAESTPQEPDVMDWGKEVIALMKNIVAEQNEMELFDDAIKTQLAIKQFHGWLWDLADCFVHEAASHYMVKKP